MIKAEELRNKLYEYFKDKDILNACFKDLKDNIEPNEVNIKRINGKRHKKLQNLSRKELDLKYHEDIVISGLGFVKTILEGKVYIYVDKDVSVFTRKSII